jgi:hypothetical protein
MMSDWLDKEAISQIRIASRVSEVIFFKAGIEEILNLQPKGSQAKSYQVKQVRELIVKYQLEID